MRLSWFQITENSCRVSDNSGTKLPHDGSHRPFATNHSRDTNPLSLGQGIALGQTYHQFHLVWITNMKKEVTYLKREKTYIIFNWHISTMQPSSYPSVPNYITWKYNVTKIWSNRKFPKKNICCSAYETWAQCGLLMGDLSGKWIR